MDKASDSYKKILKAQATRGLQFNNNTRLKGVMGIKGNRYIKINTLNETRLVFYLHD